MLIYKCPSHARGHTLPNWGFKNNFTNNFDQIAKQLQSWSKGHLKLFWNQSEMEDNKYCPLK